MGTAGMNIAERLLAKGAEHLEGLFNRGVSNAEGSKFGRGALNLAGNKSWEMGLTEGGQAIEKMHNEYIRLHDGFLGRRINNFRLFVTTTLIVQRRRH